MSLSQPLDARTLELFWHDGDARETRLRQVVTERLALRPPPQRQDAVVATYFMALRSTKFDKAVAEIAYHATSGIKNPPPGSLLAQCTAQPAGVDLFDSTGRLGLLHVAFPLKMMLQPDGHLTSCDLLHTAAAAILFDVYENHDSRLVGLQIPESVLRTFPGPAHGPKGFRRLCGLPPGEPAFGTILKPTAGLTAAEVGQLTGEAAASPLLSFIKEDEDLYPNLPYAPLGERTRLAKEAVARAMDRRGGRRLVFLPHVSGAPGEILTTVEAALEAGAEGVMFSESFAGGTVRMVRDTFRAQAPLIYGHNAGIGVKTRAIYREVIDLLARLDGIDFRQTSPVRPGTPFLKPYGQEWVASEEILSRPLPGIAPTTLVRAGALDQGNIGLNMAEAEARGIGDGVMFLAGSAINSIKNASGKYDPALGAAGMQQAIAVHRAGSLRGVSAEEHLQALVALAERENLAELREALRQRYPQEAA
jgi:ribulose 1,5-bisphosphate carboxylase large subunit-like protein